VPVPILKQGDVLIASMQEALTDHALLELRDRLSDEVGRLRARAVIIDVTALDVVDSFATRTLRGMAHAARLRGARTVVVGIQPEVAFAMVELGLTLEGVSTALDLEEGLALVQADRRGRSNAR
jgi:rsbT antagonist protein RsbS